MDKKTIVQLLISLLLCVLAATFFYGGKAPVVAVKEHVIVKWAQNELSLKRSVKFFKTGNDSYLIDSTDMYGSLGKLSDFYENYNAADSLVISFYAFTEQIQAPIILAKECRDMDKNSNPRLTYKEIRLEDTQQWQPVSLTYKLDDVGQINKLYFYNPNRTRVYFDDLQVELIKY